MLQMKNILIMLFLFGISSCSTTTYYVVRHAEKADATSSDPVLSAEGGIRAVALKDSLLSKGIDSIFVSSMQRTQLTAAPLAVATGIAPVVIQASMPGTQSLITRLKKITGNQSILIVGHSNTVPIIVDSLMRSPQHIAIPENDFDNFYQVKIKHSSSPKRTLQIKTYGAVSP